MNPLWLVVFAIANWASTPQPFRVQFVRIAMGQMVTVCIDGQKVERTFAGKMQFRDDNHAWQSVCADVRSPVAERQIFTVTALRSSKMRGNIALAGNIVAKYFKSAQTPDQCAGLQIAVWKMIEDGPDATDFFSGRLQVRASSEVLAYAQQYFQGGQEPGEASFIQASPAVGQSQLSTVT